MPAATAYRRAPLVNPAYVSLSDTAVHTEGLQEELIKRALSMVDVAHMSSLDAVLATRLGGYAELPPMPDVEAAASFLPKEPGRFITILKSASMLAAMSKDREGMLRVLGGMRAFLDALPTVTEEKLFWCGADALRLTLDLYRRTGQPFLLNVLETLRSQLPDVSGLMHTFPFQREYRQGSHGSTEDEKLYYQRMERFAMGRGAADALAMTALLAQYSGSGRDAAAPAAGLAALSRFHGMPSGAFSADPYLAGRDPARAVELDALCAQIEALLDALCLTGEVTFAERLESLMVNSLPDMLLPMGVRSLQPANRLANDESCQTHKPDRDEMTALLRALYALRRGAWMTKDDNTIAWLLPVDGGCLTRMNGVPVRLTAKSSGLTQREVEIRVECKQAVSFALQLRIPSYADAASVSVNGAKALAVPQGELYVVNRTFQNGDVVTLHISQGPRLEAGFRGSMSVFFGGTLMALALPEPSMAWRYALVTGMPLTFVEDDGHPDVLLAACEAQAWQEKAGFILPPPQAVPMGPAYELTLIPYAGTEGRITAFPCARA
ncbi:MAG: glycoside hydrolase family 127 protein [Eubacteriales bacterium]|nr:glycoside hydrolase family 127 protein [Eubacteriales bacterium]